MKQNIDRLIKALWIKACRFDKIDPESKFCCFSNDNPYARRHNKIMLMKIACAREIMSIAIE